MHARIETISCLEIFEVNTKTQRSDKAHHDNSKINYTKKPRSDFPCTHYNHFPVILNSDGGPWPHANRFLLNKLKLIIRPAYKTLESIAIDLQNFRRWLDNEKVDYLKFSKNIFARPTYQYCTYLHDEINQGNISPNTAKRRMGNVQNFYRWLEYTGIKFAYPLWQERDAYITFKNDKGFSGFKKVKKTNLAGSIKTPKHRNNYSDCIEDGGKLRPLPKDEQKALIQALKNISNPEMTLAFLIALTTGARLQTVFTLRRQYFEKPPVDNSQTIKIKAGVGTLVDTKYSKAMVLFIPGWLYERIYIYMKSERAQKRLQRSHFVYEKENHQYLFLTHTGLPYYISNQDPFIDRFKIPPKGNGVAQFILQQLKPELTRLGYLFSIRFHDLRATFGMNLVEEKQSTLSNTADLFNVLMFVRDRMGHCKLSTTENYLNYQRKTKLAVSIQSEFEKYIMQQIEC